MLYGSTTVLRSPMEEDISILLDIRNDIHLQSLLASRARASTPQRIKEWISSHLNNFQTIFFVISSKDSNEALGYIQLTGIDFINGFGELGICLHSSKQSRGHGKEALALLENYVQETFGLRKIILKVLASNEKAISFYKKSDYVVVGTYQKHFYYQKLFHDLIIMEKIFSRKIRKDM